LPKTALISGGANGIGYAIARRFSMENINVAIADIFPPEKKNSGMAFQHCDVTNATDIDTLFSWMKDGIGLPDILVINAGLGIEEKLTEGDPEKWQQVINTNLMGALRCVRAFVPNMVEQKKGHVVFISSVAANQPHPYGGIYSASKTALEIIADTLRMENLPYIKVTVAKPGITDTDFFKNQLAGHSTVANLENGALAAEDIAEDIFYVVNKNKGTSINNITIRPTQQKF
tara:strand:+ start:239 stop:931 length:693 start_codon:yes stop_codon:yes gene_type:complete